MFTSLPLYIHIVMPLAFYLTMYLENLSWLVSIGIKIIIFYYKPSVVSHICSEMWRIIV
jgi:hypothetical protein